MTKLRNRRGVTLVLMAFMMTVLLGSAAFTVDFGRIFMFKSQLQVAADASALAGAQRILVNDATTAVDSAVAYGTLHKVGAGHAKLASSDVVLGSWTAGGGFVASTFVPASSDPGLDAVKTTTRDTASYGLGRIFGLTTRPLAATAIAVMGYVGKTTCLRPVALPYQSLLDQLTRHDGVARDATTYTLTDADVAVLRSAGAADAVQLRVTDEGTSPVTGNFYGIQLGPYQYADGTLGNPNTGMANFDTDLGGPCSGESYKGTVGPGDWLSPENGEGGANIPHGISLLCGGINVNGNSTVACPAPYPEIKVVLWSPNAATPAGCSNCFYAKVIGEFSVTGYVSTPGHTGSDGVIGFFSSIPSDGSFTLTPSPIRKLALVQ